MTITLEKIKEMNIPVGTPIEITTNYKNFSNYKIKGYFQGLLKNFWSEGGVVYSCEKLKSKINVKVDPFRKEGIPILQIPYIKEIKIIKTKK